MVNTIMFLLWVFCVVGVITSVSGRPRWLDGQVITDEAGEGQHSSYWTSILQRPVQKINSMLNKLLNMEDNDDGQEVDINLVSATSGIDGVPTFSRREVSAEEIEVLVQKANAHLDKGEMNSVIDTFFAILDADPTRVDVNTVLGSVLMSMKKYDLAQTFLYTAVTQSNWTDPVAVSTLSECLVTQDQNDVLLAERVAARGLSALQNKDETGALQAALGLIKSTAGNYSEAADWYLAAALVNPTNVQYWLQASTMLYPNRDLKFAENVLLQGLESHPNSPALLYHMGSVMHYTDRIEAAIPFYEECLRQDYRFSQVKMSLATAYHAVRRFEEANTLYAALVDSEPNNTVLLANYALLLCDSLQQYEVGIQVANRARSLDPTNPEALRAATACASSNREL